MRTKTLTSLVAVAMVVGSFLDQSEARTWTDAKSGKTLEADFVGLKGTSVTLKLSTGRTVDVPLARLIAADQEFAKGAAASGVTGTGTGGTDWPTWRGANRDGLSPDKGLLKEWPEGGPKLLWTFKECGKGYSSPAVVGGRLYYTGSRERKSEIICLDAASGKELWATEIGNDPEKGYNTSWGAGTRGAPTVSDGLVYAINANGELGCVSARDGAKKWNKNLVSDFGGKIPGWGYSESPLVDGEKVIVTPGGSDGAIVALDKKTGKTIWQSEDLTDGAQYSSVIIADVKGKRHYIQLFMKTLAGVDAENGKVLWKTRWPNGRTAVIPTPIYQDGHVYATSGYGAGCKLVKIDGGEAEDVWENKTITNHHGGVILVDGHVYGFSNAGGLVCQEFKSGEKKWSERGQGKNKGAVHYADGMLYCLDEGERSVFLVEASPAGFKEHGRFTLPQETSLRQGTRGKVWTHPVVIGGRLYLRDQDLVFCYDVTGK